MNADELMTEVVMAILANDIALAAIPPLPDLADDGEEAPDTRLNVRSEFTGSSLRDGIRDYTVTVILDRAFRSDEVNQAEFEMLWQKVNDQLENWLTFFTDLDISAQVSHLTIDNLNGSGEPSVENQRISRTITFDAFLRKA